MEKKPSGLRAFYEKHREIIMYCVFGVVTTVVSWLIYSVAALVLGDYVEEYLLTLSSLDTGVAVFSLEFAPDILYANIISWILSVAVAFVTNKLWVFDSRSWEGALVRKEALTFFGGRALTGVLEILAVPLFVGLGLNQTLFGIEGLPAKIIVSVAIVILNFFISKFVSFRKKEAKA